MLEQERQEIATIEEPCWQRGRVGVYTLALASAEEQRGEAHDQRRKKPDRQPQAPLELPPPGSYLQNLLLEKKDEVAGGCSADHQSGEGAAPEQGIANADQANPILPDEIEVGHGRR